MCVPYKNEFWGWKRSKKIVSKTPILKFLNWKTRIKHVKNIDLLHELPFYDELSIRKKSQVFKRYARSYKIGKTDSKSLLAYLEALKSSIEFLSKDLSNEIKGFKY